MENFLIEPGKIKKAYQEKRSIIDVALEETDLDEKTLKDILDPLKLTQNR